MAKNRKIASFVARKKTDSNAVNFLALVAGISTTLILVLNVWNAYTAPPDSDREIAATEGEMEKGVSNAKRVNAGDYDYVMKHGTTEELEELLVRLNSWNRTAPLTVRVDENLKRARVASQLLTNSVTSSQRYLAIDSQLNALSIVYGLDLLHNLRIADVGPNLLVAAESYLDDPSPSIARSARLAFAKVKCFEFFKDSNNDHNPEPIITLIMDLLHDFPDDEIVLSSVKLIVVTLPKFNRELGKRIMNSICQKSAEFSSTKEREFFRQLRDEGLLIENNFESLLDNRWVNGEAGQRELLKVAMILAQDTTGAENLLTKVDSVANWYEQIHHPDQAGQIYQAFVDSALLRSTPELTKLAQTLGEDGIRRCELRGKKLTISGQLTLGGTLDSTEAENKIVIIIFWSVHIPGSTKILQEFHENARELVAKNVLVLAVCTDPARESVHMRIAKNLPGFRFIDCATADQPRPTLLDQYPTGQVPKAVLVDQHGIVVDANAPIDELISATNFLLVRQQEN